MSTPASSHVHQELRAPQMEPEDSWQLLTEEEDDDQVKWSVVLRWERIARGARHLARKRRFWGLQGAFLRRVRERGQDRG